jgi:hypothetical protein
MDAIRRVSKFFSEFIAFLGLSPAKNPDAITRAIADTSFI